MPDVFLLLRFRRPDEVVSGTFASLVAELGVPLRPVLPWTEWVSVDGDLSLIRLPAGLGSTTGREMAVSDVG